MHTGHWLVIQGHGAIRDARGVQFAEFLVSRVRAQVTNSILGIWEGPRLLGLTRKNAPFPYFRFSPPLGAQTRHMPCRVRTREKKIELNSRTKPHSATNHHTDMPTREWRRLLGAVWYDCAARLAMPPREAQWCVCDRVLTLRVHDRTTTTRN